MSEPPSPTFGRLIAQTARLWRRVADQRLQPYGLTEATWLPLLRIARAAKPMRQKDLAASLSLDGSSVVRLLDNLERAGLIERREQGADRRAKEIRLTAEGRKTVAEVERVARTLHEEATRGLDPAALASATGVLEQLCRQFSQELGEGEE